jgi:Mini-chromosome maintenance replisome factor
MYLPLTLETLDTKKFSPRKNYDTNLLESGLLQMVDGTFLIGDETVMKTGTLKENGILSIKAMATLIEQQVVEYDFQYYQQSYPINAGVIILSEGRSMFKNSTHLPLSKASGPAPFDEEKFKQILADEELMNAMRRYFLILNTFSDQTLVDFAIPTAVSEYAQ